MSENENAKTAGAPVGPSAGTPAGTLLVEARTEELPPQLLRGLAAQFPQTLLANLRRSGFADDESFPETDDGERGGSPKLLATPRRIVALLRNIRRAAADRTLVRRGPQVTAALDKDGRPTKALEGFLRATGKAVGDLRKLSERGREYFAVDLRESGGTLESKLAAIVQESLLSLNAPRLMRWGANDWRFIRPLRGLAMLWESEAIAGEVMGVKSGRTTLGHRFMSDGPVGIPSAGEYEGVMEGAKVVVDFHARRRMIVNQLVRAAQELKAWVFPDNKVGETLPLWDDSGNFLEGNSFLQHEISEICEHPTVVCGIVDERFLNLPAKCVALCMQKHQRFFPLGKNEAGEESTPLNREIKLSPSYLAVADNAPDDLSQIVGGYDRVLSARLADVAFYLAEDRKAALDENREKLKRIVCHEKLGSQHDRAERIRVVARAFSRMQGTSDEEVEEAARICKADLPTLMVGEYPELAGHIAGICFAKSDRIRRAVEDHERTGIFGGDIGKILALANHLEKLVGFFGIGEKPTGSKDPFGLRRSAANVASILMTSRLECPALIHEARKVFGGLPHFDAGEIYDYIADRLRQNSFIVQTGAGAMELNAIFALRPPLFADVKAKAEGLVQFRKTPEAAVLIEANKRINNIFRKSGADPERPSGADARLFKREEERRLGLKMGEVAEEELRGRAAGNFKGALLALSALAAPLDAFFDKVMVNADDEKVRANRFALLAELRALLNQVADISKLAG